MVSGYWARRQDVSIGPAKLAGTLSVPDQPRGLVIFAHGSDSGHDGARNVRVAAELHGRHFATLLFDLLTENEAQNPNNALNIDLLTVRVLDAVAWALADWRTRKLPIGLFGAGTGAAGALAAAAERPDVVCAVVSLSGRPDLTGREIGHVRAPTLLFVGGHDRDGLKLTRGAFQRLTCLKHLEIVPGARHLFEEEGALDAVVSEAARWFDLYLIPRSAVAASAAGKR